MKNKSKQAGFSLIELLIVVVIFGFVFTVIARLLVATVTNDARLTEQSEAQSRNNIVSDVLQKDFAQPLRLLSSLSVSRSGTTPVKFEANNDYQTTPGQAQRTAQSNSDWLKSSLVLKNGGAIAGYVPPNNAGSVFGWRTAAAGTTARFTVIEVSSPQADGGDDDGGGGRRSFSITSGGGSERTGTIAAFDRIEARVERLSIGCRIGFFSVQGQQITLLGRSNEECPAVPLEVVAAVSDTGAGLSQIKMTGSFEERSGEVRTAPLPYVQGSRMTKPIFINQQNGDLVLFRAEDATDKTFLLAAASFQPVQQTRINIKTPARGQYKAGDYVFLIDYSQAVSVVLRVINDAATAASGTTSQSLTVEPVFTASSAAWGLFYSLPADFTAAPFSIGAEVVRLAAPVMYRYLSGTQILVRREGTGLFQTVAPGVAGFNATISSGSLEVEVLGAAEGVETSSDPPVQSTRLSIPIN